MGPSAQENQNYGDLSNATGFATNLGEKDLQKSSDFMGSILSGDPTKIATVLAPQIGTATTSANQQNKTLAEFGNRGGGTAATTAATNDKLHASITDMIASMTGTAASSLGSQGSGLLNSGMSGYQNLFADANTLQKQRAAKINDIFSSSAAVAAGVLGGLPAGSGSFADIAGNMLGGVS